MSDEGERTCPLCAEEMDLTDQQLKPCRCGYEICVWCWHHIMDMAEKDDTDGRCPACRSPYDKEKIVGTASKCERLLSEINMEKKVKNQKAKSKSSDGRKQLSSVRVIQRNLVYIVGLPLNLADEDLLQNREYFGQYGKVLKVSMSRTAAGIIQQFPNETCSVYITYSKEDEAIRCIQNVHGFVLEGRPLRACFGTTKYCHAWLRNSPCINPDCLYLHEVGSQEDSFTKDEIISAYTSRVQQITGTTNSMQRRSGNVLPPPLDDFSINSTEKPIVKNDPTNSVPLPTNTVRSSSPNGINGRHVPLPTSAAWGTQATSCQSPVGGLSNPSVLSKPKSDTVNGTLAFSTAVTGTIQTSAAPCDGSRRPPSSDGSHNTIPRVKKELSKPVKQYHSMDSLANAGEKTSACDVSPAPVSLNSELSSRPLSRDSDRGNGTIANTLNSTNITGHSFSSGHEEAVSATSEVIRNLSTEFSSINIGTSTSNEQFGLNKPSSPPIDHVLTKSQIQEGSQYDVDRLKDPITTNVVGKISTSDNGVFSPKEQFGGILNSQSPLVLDTADIEDDVISFDNQRLKDPEVCLSYLPKATNFLNVSKLSSPSLMQYGEQCTAGNAGSLSSDDRVRDESILHSSSSMFCNGYPEKLISGSSNGLLHDERNRQSIGRLVGDAGCDAAIDKGESSIISNILSIDFDPWNDSITSPHNIVKLLGDNADSQPSPLKKSSSWKVQSNNQSRFSFARQEEESKIQTFDMHSSYAVSQQQPKSHTLNQNLAERDFYMDNLGIANGFPTSNFEEAENIGSVHSIASSNKLSREYYYLP
ncbi:RING-type E3 ubiquitin transferase [Trifolium repens]|nr:RING-type E3 ubiquitin transferase [Trifolium repens]